MSGELKEQEYIVAIINQTGLSQQEILQLAEEKRKKLKGLISLSGALFMITKELKVNIPVNNTDKEFDELKTITIKDLTINMKNLTLKGSIKEIGELRTFTKKTGEEGRVRNFILQDNENSEIRIVAWDELTNIIDNPKFKIDAQIKITSGLTKHNSYWDKLEVNLANWSTITFEDIKESLTTFL